MVLLSQIDQTETMRGLITTVSRDRATITPVSAPIVYQRLAAGTSADYGEFVTGDAAFARYRRTIDTCIDEGFVTVIPR